MRKLLSVSIILLCIFLPTIYLSFYLFISQFFSIFFLIYLLHIYLYLFPPLNYFIRHVQCVLNFADNTEEDGGTIIVPKSNHFIKNWCGAHTELKKKLPWLTFSKEIVKINKNEKKKEINNEEEKDKKMEKVKGQEKEKVGNKNENGIPYQRGKKNKAASVLTPVRAVIDHEAPLLALAQRIPMRQVC